MAAREEGRRRRSIGEVLAGARVLEDAYDDYDVGASRVRIAAHVATTLWRGATSLHDWACSAAAVTAADRPVVELPPLSPSWHDQAARDLRTLSTLVINDSAASACMSRLVNHPRMIEPEGALVFACLLHLTGRAEGAQFWWQFAAGAGNPTSAYCLYLLHMQHGELRDAEHWADQAAALESYPVDPSPEEGGDGAPHDGIRIRYDAEAAVGGGSGGTAPHGSLEAAVDRLEVDGDDEYGTIPKPDADLLACELEELAAP